MKKKYLNLLIVMFTFCLMFINMEEVKAGCTYHSDNTLYKFASKTEFVALGDNSFSCDDGTNCTVKDESGLFVDDDKITFCPTKVYTQKLTTQIESHKYAFKKVEEGDTLFWEKTEAEDYYINATSGTHEFFLYEPIIDDAGNLIPCTIGGQAKYDKWNSKYKELNKKIKKNNSDSEIQQIASEYEKLQSELTNKEIYYYCEFRSNKVDLSKFVTKLNALEDNILSKMDKKQKEEQQEKYDKNKEKIEDAIKDNTSTTDDTTDPFYDTEKTYSCEGLISDDLEAVIQFALKIVRIAAPILLIILCTIDFSQAVISGDQDALKKTTSKVVKRAIAALALFLVPFFVSLAIDWVDDSEYFNKDATKCTEVLK